MITMLKAVNPNLHELPQNLKSHLDNSEEAICESDSQGHGLWREVESLVQTQDPTDHFVTMDASSLLQQYCLHNNYVITINNCLIY